MTLRHEFYILASDNTLRAVDLHDWATWFEENHTRRQLARSAVPHGRVSTVFLGLDHNFDPAGPPLVFETMVFGGPHDQYQRRYATYGEAMAGHAQTVAMASAGSTWWLRLALRLTTVAKRSWRWVMS